MCSNNFAYFLLAGTGIFFSCLSLADNEGEVTGKNKARVGWDGVKRNPSFRSLGGGKLGFHVVPS